VVEPSVSHMGGDENCLGHSAGNGGAKHKQDSTNHPTNSRGLLSPETINKARNAHAFRAFHIPLMMESLSRRRFFIPSLFLFGSTATFAFCYHFWLLCFLLKNVSSSCNLIFVALRCRRLLSVLPSGGVNTPDSFCCETSQAHRFLPSSVELPTGDTSTMLFSESNYPSAHVYLFSELSQIYARCVVSTEKIFGLSCGISLFQK
jgi:hypothetical protein